jgi:hypothetical protein
LEAGLAHPIYEPLRRFIEARDAGWEPGLRRLNELAEERGVRTEGGLPLRFVEPDGDAGRYGGYELRIFETGCVETRPGNLHDVFNALAWLAYPLTKARLNALHAREIPKENGRRGRFRDLLTLLDEGGAIVCCPDAELLRLVREHRWVELFWERRAQASSAMQVHVLGHAVLEQALRPWPGITCKAILLGSGCDADEAASRWLSVLPVAATPADAAAFPVFGLPGWHPHNDARTFYEDKRYFRPHSASTMTQGVGRAAAVRAVEARRKVRAP